jgi:MFS family permease
MRRRSPACEPPWNPIRDDAPCEDDGYDATQRPAGVNLLLKERDFHLIVVAVGLSSFGDVLAAVALTIRVHDLTGAGFAVAALLLADLVAHVVLAPWAGMLVDRVETVRVLGVVSLGQAAVALAIAAALLRVRRPPEEAGREGTGERAGAREGFSFLWGEPVLRLAAVVLTITVVFAVMDNVALVFFAKDTLEAGDRGYGILVSAWTAGMVAGIFLVARRLRTQALAPGVILADASAGVAVLTAATWPVFPFAVGLFVVGGAGNGIGNVARRSLIHHRTPDRLQGRVFAANAALPARGRSPRSPSGASSSRR